MANRFNFLWIVAFIMLLAGAGLYLFDFDTQQSHPKFVYKDTYFNSVKPIFDARCVACHACYNSPCQLNLTSYDGVLRGASSKDPYKFPLLEANPPTRLGIDATTESQWREKGFFSVINSSKKKAPSEIKDSILLQLIHAAPDEVDTSVIYRAEKSRVCPTSNPSSEYLAHLSMPYGLPKLQSDEIKTLTDWVLSGARGPNADVATYLTEPHDEAIKKDITSWEELLNIKDFKHQLSARYLYEHLFSAHINFQENQNEFFRLVRAKNRKGVPEEIATVRPFDDPKTKDFFYRFKKVNETIVHKSHTVFALNDKILANYEKDFLQSSWTDTVSALPGYGNDAANAFLVFKSIPAETRYKFFLENARYFIMTFMKGPVCRGQTALNVINDHFWVMFLEPSKDVSVSDKDFITKVAPLLSPPASQRGDLDLFNKVKDQRWKAASLKTKTLASSKIVLSDEAIWNGFGDTINPNSLLTVYRHYDSSNVLFGAHGAIPKTLWIMDYQIFEDIYYNLVAGYDVFGPILHQLNTRLYMDISRIASEDMFINFMPQAEREQIRASWTRPSEINPKGLGEKLFEAVEESLIKNVKFDYRYVGKDVKNNFISKPKTSASDKPNDSSSQSAQHSDPKAEFLNQLMETRFAEAKIYKSPHLQKQSDRLGQIDVQNFSLETETSDLLNSINGTKKDYIKYFPDVSFLRIKNKAGQFKAFSIIKNEFHFNVSMVFFESLRRDPSLDTLDILPVYAASYPNHFFDLDEVALQDMIKQLNQGQSSVDYCNTLKKFGVKRSDPKFWPLFDWFNEDFKKQDPIESGVFDLNRYLDACQA